MMGGKLEEGQHGMTNTDTDTEIDWTGCDLVERIPGKVAGRPIVRGTRIAADTIVQDFELGEHRRHSRGLPFAFRRSDQTAH